MTIDSIEEIQYITDMADFVPNPANYTMKGNPPKPNPIAIAPEIDPTDVNAVKAMVWDKLVQIAAVIPPNAQALPVLREIMDRLEGKPAQSVNMNVQDNRMDKLPIDKLLRLASMLDEPIIIPPLPTKILE